MRKNPRPLNPFQMIALTFLFGLVIGTVLLSMPFSAAPGKEVTFLQALFTATSALCITGLAVLDTASTFSVWGELVIMVLIQIGGLGILTFGTAFAVFAGRRMGVQERLNLATQLGGVNAGEVKHILVQIFRFVMVIELAGTLLLYIHFLPLEGPVGGLYYAAFHAVSAFNNAGFALYPDSLMRFVDDKYVNLVISALVILGSMGFLVMASLLLHLQKPRQHRLDLNAWISIWTSVFLLLLGFFTITALEWNNPATLGKLHWSDRIMAGFFHSVAPRSIGFNTVDYGLMHHGTLLITIMLMFVGANPGSTGGGIKTTTFFVLITSVWSMLRGRGEMVAFKRRIEQDIVMRAGVVAVMSLSIIVFALFLLTITEQENMAQGKLTLLQIIFETFSAFCTVGLSMNATGQFSDAGKIILAFLMYVGRIGPLTFAIALSTRSTKGVIHYPADRNIQIG
ncbi:TrkH family potassium uptake protein [Deinococcus cellulosilyticus]|uniref:Potassium transporter KtrB n=1 Tax=Deinococcus cellulosilyticus (strain DSM 18568 / NBRC 106333 / KACC 11606 / 5516J-15) TaxID=1223518 RepID=A0A511N8T3_DEIC1|nr:TrkH family potassium uptake protein [Deinococcus cellulosilyticus]GEM49263.1 potassium transporter KtrB [Deinococcus cellulosilyticus NBRC 106333 = KACC 11606]